MRTLESALLTAPAGCGKTEYLARRAAFLVKEGLVKAPQQILALTYSNKATANLSERLRKYLGPGSNRFVVVTNFHRFGFRLIHHHGPLVGHVHDDRPLIQGGSISRIRNLIANEYGIHVSDLGNALRIAKCGPFDNDEVLERLRRAGKAALAYEVRLRAEGRCDYDDAIRLGLLLAMRPSVAALYRARFPIILVDEVQDLSQAHLDLVECIDSGSTTFAGDRAQGIYGFAGAAPKVVYDRIMSGDPLLVDLTESYRSAPAILRVVSWSSVALGGSKLVAAADVDWSNDGEVVVERFGTPPEESDWVLDRVRRWQIQDPKVSIGVIVRAGSRRRWLDDAARAADISAEFWDYPAHRPAVVSLLRRFVKAAVRDAGDSAAGLDALYLMCFETLELDELQTHDELVEAVESMREFVDRDGLSRVVGQIRHLGDPNLSAPAGFHLLNAHLGKGQQFDKVIVLGMEDGHIPNYRAKSRDELHEELSVLHVMTSRARTSLVFTVCNDVPNGGKSWIRDPSRWLRDVEVHATGWLPED